MKLTAPMIHSDAQGQSGFADGLPDRGKGVHSLSIRWSAVRARHSRASPRPGMTQSGSSSTTGARANARSCTLGWGTVSPGSSIVSLP